MKHFLATACAALWLLLAVPLRAQNNIDLEAQVLEAVSCLDQS